MALENVIIGVDDPDALIAGTSEWASFAAAKIQLYRYGSEADARSDTSGTLATTFTLIGSDESRSDPDIAGPWRYGFYDSAQDGDTFYTYRFADSDLTNFSPFSEPWQADNTDEWALRDILFEIGTELPEMIRKGTASGGSTSTAICASLFTSSKVDSHLFEGWYLYVTKDAGGSSAAPEKEEAIIDSVDTTTGTATLDRALTAAIASGDTILITPLMPVSEMIRHINVARQKMRVEVEEDMPLTPDVNRYPAPEGFKAESDFISASAVVSYTNSARQHTYPIDMVPKFDGRRWWLDTNELSAPMARVTMIRSYRDMEGTLTAMTDKTACPEEWWRPAFAFAIVEAVLEGDEGNGQTQRFYSQLKDDVAAATSRFGASPNRNSNPGHGRDVLPGPAWIP